MTRRIKLMDKGLSTKIAAGEVVERPASVVKELIENSLDAGASMIAVSVEEGGKRSITIIDDGTGIVRDDALLAFTRHATSKLTDEADLDMISTMGFRGEALATISSVARVTLKTRTTDEVEGTSVQVTGGSEANLKGIGTPVGTSIEVRDIFHNTPARAKFLRTPQTEYGRILDSVKRIALINPSVRFKLTHGKTTSLDLKPGTLKDRIFDIFGKDVAGGVVAVNEAGGNAGFGVKGFVGTPELTYTTAKGIYTYINGRWVRDKTINRAITDGFSGMLEARRYPFVVLDIELPLGEVDVNVHPGKFEVRFERPSFVYDLVRAAVSNAVSGNGERGKSSTNATHRTYGTRGGGYGRASGMMPVTASERGAARAWSGRSRSTATPAPSMRDTGIRDAQQINLKDDSTKDILWPEMATARIVGQLWGEFLVVEATEPTSDEFFIIDQHGAAERVRFEELKQHYAKGKRLPSQYLLIPERLELTPVEVEALKGALEELTRLGFEIVEFGSSSAGGAGETYLIKAVPDILGSKDNKRLVKDLVEELSAFDGSAKVTESIESVLMRIACHSVIRGARVLTDIEAAALLRDIARVDFSARCPHGRMVVKSFERAEMDKMFGRS